jgi:hypothetical protein
MTENNLFQEVQEDLERQKLEALWKKYGFWVVVAALGIVVATASSTAYRSWHADHEQRLTAELLSASKSTADAATNIDSLQKFAADNAGSGQADLALLRAGALAADKDDKAAAVKAFDQVASDTKADPAFRQLGTLLSVRAQLDNGDPAALSARLQPLTAEDAAWRFSALEDQAYLALRAGDKDKAKQIFTDLSQDARVPEGIAARATDILRSLD